MMRLVSVSRHSGVDRPRNRYPPVISWCLRLQAAKVSGGLRSGISLSGFVRLETVRIARLD